jgi:hypothetical protein
MNESVIAASRLFVAFVGPAWLADPRCQAQLQAAARLGKPVRLLLLPGTRLPAQVVHGIADLEVAYSQGVETDRAQMERWLGAMKGMP